MMLLLLEVDCHVDDLGGTLLPEEAQFIAIVRTLNRIVTGRLEMVAAEDTADLIKYGLHDDRGQHVGTLALEVT
jgi:hypothetical protein